MPHYKDEGVDIEFGGACPVQGFGAVDGHGIYFRSRWGSWRMEFYPVGIATTEQECRDNNSESMFMVSGDVGDDGFEAGWIDSETACALMAGAIAEFRASKAET